MSPIRLICTSSIIVLLLQYCGPVISVSRAAYIGRTISNGLLSWALGLQLRMAACHGKATYLSGLGSWEFQGCHQISISISIFSSLLFYSLLFYLYYYFFFLKKGGLSGVRVKKIWRKKNPAKKKNPIPCKKRRKKRICPIKKTGRKKSGEKKTGQKKNPIPWTR